MSESLAIWWWVAAGAVVVAELTTGTFYLLMVALGLAAGALAAHMGLDLNAQIITAALTSMLLTALWHFYRRRHSVSVPSHQNRDVNLDIGEKVQVPAWSADGTARIVYRGTHWSARIAAGTVAAPGEHTIAAMEGSTLFLTPVERRN
jgi:membrane protein implicated in regulation of membrane protease activity